MLALRRGGAGAVGTGVRESRQACVSEAMYLCDRIDHELLISVTRTFVSILIGPGVAATLMSAIHVLHGRPTVVLPAYYMFTYAFAFVPAAALIVILRVSNYHKLWHYLPASFVLSVVCTAAFVLLANAGATSFDPLLKEFLALWELMVVGPVTGGFIWIVSESNLLNKLFPKSSSPRKANTTLTPDS